MNKQEAIHFALGLASGALVGASVVLVVTPQSGAELRQAMVDKKNELIELGRQARLERRRELEQQYKEAIRIPLPVDQAGPAQV